MKLLSRYLSILLVAVFTACGDEEKKEAPIRVGEEGTLNTIEKPSDTRADSSTDQTVSEDGVVQITITANDQMQFSTKEIRVKAGQKVRLTLKHVGQLPENAMGHNWVLLEKGTDISSFAQKAATAGENYIPAGGEQVIANTEMIGGGEETTIEFMAPEAGTYDFICSFPGHWVMMQGRFIVE